jgi:hypothetical protein
MSLEYHVYVRETYKPVLSPTALENKHEVFLAQEQFT